MANFLQSLLRRILEMLTQPANRTPPAPGAGSTRTPAPHRPRVPNKPPVPHKPAPPAKRHLGYEPDLDGDADPGEIVWTWVKYEDDPSQGKDRPVLVVGRDGRNVLALMLSSQSERDGQHNWMALGPGDWDRESRPSWLRLDRVIEVDQDGIRREGAILDRARFDRVADRLRTEYGWA